VAFRVETMNINTFKMLNQLTKLSIISIATLSSAPLLMADDFFGTVTTSEHESPPKVDSDFQLNGYFQQRVSYGTGAPSDEFLRNQADITRAESLLNVHAQWRPTSYLNVNIGGQITHDWLPQLESQLSYTFSKEDKDARQLQLAWQDTTISASWNDMWLTAGYQTIALGESESAIIVDVISPRNNVWPGQNDLDESRLPVPAVSLNVPFGNGQFNALATYKAGTDKVAPTEAEFDSLIAFRPYDVSVDATDPKSDIEYAAWWQAHFSGSDVSFVIADVNQNQPHLTSATFTLVGSQPVPTGIETTQNRYQLIGGTANKVFGRWLVRAEGAYKHGVVLTPSAENYLSPWPTDNTIQGMFGFEFTGPAGWSISAETLTQYAFESEQFSVASSSRIRWAGFNDRLTLQAIAAAMPEENVQFGHGLTRATAAWNLADGWNTEFSGTWYHAAEPTQTLFTVREQDTISLSLRGNF
jgi:hypothetical protein